MLRRLHRRQARLLSLLQERETLLLELLPKTPEPPPPPILELTPEPLATPPIPVLTPEEVEELKKVPMPDPVAELEARLGLSTSPPSAPTSVG
jgi:hypothetical protein